MPGFSHQLIVFSYHKTGTSLFLHVMTKVAERLGLTLANYYGMVDAPAPEPDVLLLPHSMLRKPPERPYRAIRLIRDPRDIWVSGYLYHRRCDELWCTNADMDATAPIGWPRVDYSVLHWPEDWKRRYLGRLGGRSYQQNLLDRTTVDGLDFELDGYTACTLATMRQWGSNRVNALDVKLEEVMADFDGSIRRIFDHFGFSAAQSEAALEVARTEDVRRMDDAVVAERPQISSRRISKWREMLTAAQVARFEDRYSDLIIGLGYRLASAGSSHATPGRNPISPTDALVPAPAAEDDAQPNSMHWSDRLDKYARLPAQQGWASAPDVWLSAGRARIRPSAVDRGTYVFVVPPGQFQVVLESGYEAAATSAAPDVKKTCRAGICVRQIVISCDTGEFVIAADDPSLNIGWHDVEYVGEVLGRLTGGTAEVPWTGVSGPAIVTVRCMTYSEPCGPYR